MLIESLKSRYRDEFKGFYRKNIKYVNFRKIYMLYFFENCYGKNYNFYKK